VKLCQDEIENSRINSYQHPTREELIDQYNYLSEQFEKFAIYVDGLRKHVQSVQRGTLVR
jgi:hypothetical protein